MTRTLILGTDGMLGHVLSNFIYANSNIDLYNLSRKNISNFSNHYKCDLKDISLLKKVIEEINPDIIINCSGILIKGSNNSIEDAIYINSYLPHFLKGISNIYKFKLIHLSTDCVFSGKDGKYSEESVSDAKDIYGITKYLGEINHHHHLTIRTSIIGPEIKEDGEGLFNWFINQKGNVYGYSKAIWSGVTTIELSKAILFSINKNLNGLWNLSAKNPINKFDLLDKIKNKFNINDINLLKDDNLIVDKSLISKRKISYIVPSYDEMINEMFEYININKNVYNFKFL